MVSWSLWLAAVEARARQRGAGPVGSGDGGRKPCGLEEQGRQGLAPGSPRAVAPAEGWSGWVCAAGRVLLVWAEPHGAGAVLGHVVYVLRGYLCLSVPWH